MFSLRIGKKFHRTDTRFDRHQNARFEKPQISRFELHQRRMLSSDVKNNHPDIGKIYNQLLFQTAGNTPIRCNFISQVVDHWGLEPNKTAIRCFDLDCGHREEHTYKAITDNSHLIGSFLLRKKVLKRVMLSR